MCLIRCMGASVRTPCSADECQVTMVTVSPPLERSVSRRAAIGCECWGTGWRNLLLTRWPCCKGQEWPAPKDSKQHQALPLCSRLVLLPHPCIHTLHSAYELIDKKPVPMAERITAQDYESRTRGHYLIETEKKTTTNTLFHYKET